MWLQSSGCFSREKVLNEANSAVARAVCEELVSRGLVSAERANALERALREGTLRAEDWYQVVEASLPAVKEPTDAPEIK